jgi:hypothetical protein
VTRDCFLEDLHPQCAPPAPDQDALGRFIHGLLDTGEDDDVQVVLTLIPSLDLSDGPLLRRLAAHDDFFVPEALADAIAARPASGLRHFPALCQAHPHSQVSRAGQGALTAIDPSMARDS